MSLNLNQLSDTTLESIMKISSNPMSFTLKTHEYKAVISWMLCCYYISITV